MQSTSAHKPAWYGSSSVVQRLFVEAARRLGSAEALGARLELEEGDLRKFLTGESIPPQRVLLRALDVVLEDFHAIRREFSEEAWRSLWEGMVRSPDVLR